MKNCATVMEKYLGLDKGQRVPLGITLHLLACKNCRTQVRLLQKAENLAAQETNQQVQLDDKSIAAVMQKIAVSKESKKNPISLSKWIVGGVAMFVLFLAFTMFTRRVSSNAFMVLTYLELAVLITIYCALFIRSNMDFFVKLINTKIPNASFQVG